MKENLIQVKSFEFAKRIINCYNFLSENKEYILSKQLLRSGTAIGAVLREAEFAESKKDFLHKNYISLKEANETRYWIDLLVDTHYLPNEMGQSLRQDCSEIIRILVTITKTLKKSIS